MTLKRTRPERPTSDADDLGDFRKTLGRRLATLRSRQGMTQQAMADLIGMSVEGLSRIERAAREPQLATLYRLSRGLRLTLPDVFTFDRLPPPALHRPDVELIARLLDDQSPSSVAKVRAVLELLFVEP